MSATSILLAFAGDVGLLLWGTHMATRGWTHRHRGAAEQHCNKPSLRDALALS
jgi:hypothetical protein